MAIRRGGQRQMKHWHGSGDSLVSFTADATGLLSTFSNPEDAATVLRTLGQYLVVPTGNGTFVAQDAAAVTLGLGIVSQDAAAVGASALPDPAGEPEYDWLWWHKTMLNFEGSVDSPGQTIGLVDRIEFDSKAMRKMKPRQSLVMIAEYVNINGDPPISVSGSFRVLFGT